MVSMVTIVTKCVFKKYNYGYHRYHRDLTFFVQRLFSRIRLSCKKDQRFKTRYCTSCACGKRRAQTKMQICKHFEHPVCSTTAKKLIILQIKLEIISLKIKIPSFPQKIGVLFLHEFIR